MARSTSAQGYQVLGGRNVETIVLNRARYSGRYDMSIVWMAQQVG